MNIGHTESRVEELSNTLAGILRAGSMSRKEAERLRGRLQWFESFSGGRVAQQALMTLSRMASAGRRGEDLSKTEIDALNFLNTRVLNAPPTRIQSTSLQTWYVFSDGACEGEISKEGSVGAVLVSPCGVTCEFFAEVVPQVWMQEFLQTSNHPIFELELLPVWIALSEWEGHLKHSQCVFYLDNEAAKGALVRGATDAGIGAVLVSAFVVSELQCQVKVWFSRVPTSSNVADGPSRMSFEDLLAKGVWRRRIDWDLLLTKLRKGGSETFGVSKRDPGLVPTAE